MYPDLRIMVDWPSVPSASSISLAHRIDNLHTFQQRRRTLIYLRDYDGGHNEDGLPTVYMVDSKKLKKAVLKLNFDSGSEKEARSNSIKTQSLVWPRHRVTPFKTLSFGFEGFSVMILSLQYHHIWNFHPLRSSTSVFLSLRSKFYLET